MTALQFIGATKVGRLIHEVRVSRKSVLRFSVASHSFQRFYEHLSSTSGDGLQKGAEQGVAVSCSGKVDMPYRYRCSTLWPHVQKMKSVDIELVTQVGPWWRSATQNPNHVSSGSTRYSSTVANLQRLACVCSTFLKGTKQQCKSMFDGIISVCE